MAQAAGIRPCPAQQAKVSIGTQGLDRILPSGRRGGLQRKACVWAPTRFRTRARRCGCPARSDHGSESGWQPDAVRVHLHRPPEVRVAALCDYPPPGLVLQRGATLGHEARKNIDGLAGEPYFRRMVPRSENDAHKMFEQCSEGESALLYLALCLAQVNHPSSWLPRPTWQLRQQPRC